MRAEERVRAGSEETGRAPSIERTIRCVMTMTVSVLTLVSFLPEISSTRYQLTVVPPLFAALVLVPTLLVPVLPGIVATAWLLGRPACLRGPCDPLVPVAWVVGAITWVSSLAVVLLHLARPDLVLVPPREGARLLVTLVYACASGFLVIGLGSRRGIAAAISYLPLMVVLRHVVSGRDLTGCVLDATFGGCLATVYFVVIPWLTARGRDIDADDARARRETEAAAALAAGAQARRRVAELVHDRVIAVLVMSRREFAVPPEVLRTEAAQALDALRVGRGMVSQECTAGSVAAELRRTAEALTDAHHTFTVTVHGETATPVEPAAWRALVDAAGEALRNVRRHAGGIRSTVGGGAAPAVGPVTCTVDVSAEAPGSRTPEDAGREAGRAPVPTAGRTVRVTVRDDGVGFDQEAVAPSSLGLRGSIYRRLTEVPGAAVHLSSAPGHGTTITLVWASPATVRSTGGTRGTRGTDAAAGAVPAAASPGATADDDAVAVPMRLGDTLAEYVTGPWGLTILGIVTATMWIHGLAQIDLYSGAWRTLVVLTLLTLNAWVLMVPPRRAPRVRAARVRAARVRAALSLLVYAVAPAVLLSGVGPVTTIDNRGWPVTFLALFTAVLFFRGLDRRAALSAALAMVSCAVGLTLAGVPARVIIEYLPYPFLTTAYLAVGMGVARAAERATMRAAERRYRAVLVRLTASAELEARNRMLSDVAERAEPVLQRLASGADADPGLGRAALNLEAELRDLIRAPRLARDVTVAQAVRAARSRGADVVLVDDSDSLGEESSRARRSAVPGPAGSGAGDGGAGPGVLGGADPPGSVGSAAAPLAPGTVDLCCEVLEPAGAGDHVVLRISPPHALSLVTAQLTRRGQVMTYRGLPRPGPGDAVAHVSSTTSPDVPDGLVGTPSSL